METKLVLERLVAAGFMVNTAKSHFLVSSIKMLGYHLQGGRRLPSYTQLKATVDANYSPKTIRDVQHLYGLLSSFRLFVPAFAQIAAPISRLMARDSLEKWTPAHDAIVRRVLQDLA